MATPPIDHLTSAAIRDQRDALASAIVGRQYSLDRLHCEALGTECEQHSLRDVRYHLDCLSEAIAVQDESLFLDYVKWASTLFSAPALGDDTLTTTLQIMLDVLPARLPPEMADVARHFVAAGLGQLQAAPPVPQSHLRVDAPLVQLAEGYLQALRAGNRRQASTLIVQAVDSGTAVRDVYLHVFQPVQRELGRLWQLGEISVAQEHLATAITQFTMSQLYPRIFATERRGRRMLAACVGDELHELGIRMVADFFEMDGWDTYYLGANTPISAIVSAVAAHKPDLLALSVTMAFHLSKAVELIEQIRSSEHHARLPVLVGGYPFNISANLWHQVGADAGAHDAEQAVTVAHRLLRERET
jgi:methanogenic corrinoid protein MtbC1